MYEEKKKQYHDICTPFTKESLLYREIFETYYPHQVTNDSKTFGCQIKNGQDVQSINPSARVLSNYGDSGK